MDFETNHADTDEELVNITSMVDVVFILLAFFVISAAFVGVEKDFAVDSQKSAESTGAAAEDLPPSIPIHLRADQSVGVQIAVGQIDLPANDFAAITARLKEINLPAALPKGFTIYCSGIATNGVNTVTANTLGITIQ